MIMAAAWRRGQLGKRVLIAFKTTHIDRAGETGSLVLRHGAVVAVDALGRAVVVTGEGEYLRCPLSKLYLAPAGGRFPRSPGHRARPDYVAAEELVRDFHSGTRPAVAKWLGKQSAIALCRAKAHG